MLNVNYAKILEQSGLFRYIMPDNYEIAVKELELSSMNFVNNQAVFRKNDKANQIAIVISGEVKAEKIHGSSGEEMVHRFHFGQMFGYEGAISNSNVYPADYISDGDSQVAFIDVDKIYTIKFARELIRGIVGYMADESINRMDRLEVLSKKKLRDRILTYMKVKEEKIGTSAFTLDITREQMAQELCVNRSALSNELGKMQREGIISIDRRKITLNK